MKLKEIFEAIKKVAKPEKDLVPVIKEDPFAMIKHATQRRYSMGSRMMTKHNNRKMTRGRRVQYISNKISSKPIYHGAL